MNTDVIAEQVHQIPWLLTRFVEQTPGATAAVCSTEDGLLSAMSEGVSRGRAEELVSIGAGLWSISAGASRRLDLGTVGQVGIEMSAGYVFVVVIEGRGLLCVVCDEDADLGSVNYEMVVLAERFASVLGPAVHEELQGLLPLD